MKFFRPLCFFAVFVLLLGLLAVSPASVRAQQGTGGGGTPVAPTVSPNSSGGRFMTVTNTYTQDSWQLVNKNTGRVLCLVNVNHEGYPTVSEALSVCETVLFPPAISTDLTPVPTNTPVPMENALDSTAFHFLASRVITQVQKIPVPAIVINVIGNSTPTLKPYVTITAYEPFSDYQITSIQGVVGGVPFTCYASSCDVVITSDTIITYWANSSFGDQSPQYSVTTRVNKQADGYVVLVTANENFSLYRDICGSIWGAGPLLKDNIWANFPQSPQELSTSHRLYYLAGELIASGQVDAKSCPGNGLFTDGSPNACGIEKATPKMIAWQNHYDPAIWSASREIGVPPVLLKSIIEQESQFWPASTRFVLFEYGLAQINEQGADVALRWDTELYNQVCSNLMMDCKANYSLMTPAAQALLRGGLVSWLNADCPSCEFGVSPQRAEQSMRVVAQILRANCYQTGYLYQKFTTSANYEDSWRFTLVSYHGGYQCLSDAIASTRTLGEPVDWEHLSTHLDSCPDAKDYVNNVWSRVTGFQPNPATVIQSRPVVEIMTPTPAPTPTLPVNPQARSGHVQVVVFVDKNNDYVLSDGELVDGVVITVKYEDGTSETQKSVNGSATFNFKDKLKGSRVTIIVPSVYRTMNVSVPDDGNIFVLIRLASPSLPSKLP